MSLAKYLNIYKVIHMKKNATNYEALQARINGNSAQSLDFISWIFQDFNLGSNINIVEFCCGTGKQSTEFLNRIDDGSHLYVYDIEQESLDYLVSQVDDSKKNNITCECLDFSDHNLVEQKLPDTIDLFFCSYGLYYNKDVRGILDVIKKRLSKNAQVVVVGPYGDNNEELFSFLEECGVQIESFVRQSSQPFMVEVVVDWMSRYFKDISLSTVRNVVTWKSWEDVFDYWKNSTFYDEKLEEVVKDKLQVFFSANTQFTNSKFIMKAVAKDELE